MASSEDHCLLDLLWRFSSGELPGEVTRVISNHRDHEQAVASFDIPYDHIPVDPEAKASAEAAVLELLRGEALRALRGTEVEADRATPPQLPPGVRRRRPYERATSAPGIAG